MATGGFGLASHQQSKLPLVPERNGEAFSTLDETMESGMDGRVEARIFGLTIAAVYICLLLVGLGA